MKNLFNVLLALVVASRLTSLAFLASLWVGDERIINFFVRRLRKFASSWDIISRQEGNKEKLTWYSCDKQAAEEEQGELFNAIKMIIRHQDGMESSTRVARGISGCDLKHCEVIYIGLWTLVTWLSLKSGKVSPSVLMTSLGAKSY